MGRRSNKDLLELEGAFKKWIVESYRKNPKLNWSTLLDRWNAGRLPDYLRSKKIRKTHPQFDFWRFYLKYNTTSTKT